jgi:MYXO-CTERM domain-containing protein
MPFLDVSFSWMPRFSRGKGPNAMSSPIKLSTVFVPALLLLWSGAALADGPEQCQEDTDCAEGYFCAKGASAPGCDPAGECPEPGVVEDAYGRCEVAPVACTTDADCDEYLSCVDSQSTTCWAGPNGESGCDEPDPDAPKYCGVAQITCSSDADCPREFECVSHSTPCPEIACVGDEPDCPRCDPTTYEVCQPKHIACDGDDDCPTDWSCGGSGSGGGVDVGEPQPTEPAPEPAFDERKSRTMSDADQRGACYPDALGGAGYVETDEARDVAPGSAEDSGSAAPGSNSSSGGGCSVGAVGASGAAGWLMTLLLVGPLARRRQRR